MKNYAVGDVIGRHYIVVSRLGEGGLGSVYLCQDSETKGYVAAKVLKPEATLESDEFIDILRQEANQLSRLRHQNIVKLYDFIQDQYGPVFIMEYVNGYTVCDPALEGPFGYESFLSCAMQCLEGLAAAHRSGLLHLDIKPENIMVVFGDNGKTQIKLLDFGISRLATEMLDPNLSGDLIASAYFVAPEQIYRSPLSAATDLYSLGLVFYEMLAGRLAYDKEELHDLLNLKLEQDAPDIRQYRPDLPEDFVWWLHRMIDRDPNQRPQSCQEAIQGLNLLWIQHTRSQEPPVEQKPTTMTWRITNSLKKLLGEDDLDK